MGTAWDQQQTAPFWFSECHGYLWAWALPSVRTTEVTPQGAAQWLGKRKPFFSLGYGTVEMDTGFNVGPNDIASYVEVDANELSLKIGKKTKLGYGWYEHCVIQY